MGTPGVIERKVRSRDGTQVTAYRAGSGPGRLVMAPGLGTPFRTWHYLIEDLRDRYTLLTWDPRGTYRSEIPSDPAHLGLEDHVADMEAVCEDAGWNRFALGGWSMGVQIALEYTQRHPEQVEALVLIAGTYEHILETALGLPGSGFLARGLVRAARLLAPGLGPILLLALGSRATLRLLMRAGMVTNNLEFFAGMVEEFRHMNWGVYLKMIERLDEHSAAPYLHRIEVPALLVAGREDRVTPAAKMEELHRAIPNSELFFVPNGTHYLLVEYPEVVNLKIEQFLSRLLAARDRSSRVRGRSRAHSPSQPQV